MQDGIDCIGGMKLQPEPLKQLNVHGAYLARVQIGLFRPR
jgi:hypothetical protein